MCIFNTFQEHIRLAASFNLHNGCIQGVGEGHSKCCVLLPITELCQIISCSLATDTRGISAQLNDSINKTQLCLRFVYTPLELLRMWLLQLEFRMDNIEMCYWPTHNKVKVELDFWKC